MKSQLEISSVIPKDGIIYFREFICELLKKKKRDLLHSEILDNFEEFCNQHDEGEKIRTGSGLCDFFSKTQEMLISDNYLTVLHRPNIATYKYYGFRNGDDLVDDLSPELFLECREPVSYKHLTLPTILLV